MEKRTITTLVVALLCGLQLVTIALTARASAAQVYAIRW